MRALAFARPTPFLAPRKPPWRKCLDRVCCGLFAGGEWIRTSSSAPDRQQFRSFVRDGHALLGAATCQPRRDEAAAKIARRVGASDLKRVLSPVAAAEVIPTEARQAFEHAGGTADRKIALLTQGYGVIRVLRPI